MGGVSRTLHTLGTGGEPQTWAFTFIPPLHITYVLRNWLRSDIIFFPLSFIFKIFMYFFNLSQHF